MNKEIKNIVQLANSVARIHGTSWNDPVVERDLSVVTLILSAVLSTLPKEQLSQIELYLENQL